MQALPGIVTGSPCTKQLDTESLHMIHLAQELGGLPNKVLIEGHTDSRPYGGDSYSNWKLSVDRVHAARKLMTANG